jgi:hypothetical protein
MESGLENVEHRFGLLDFEATVDLTEASDR